MASSDFYRLPQFRLATVLAWMLLAVGAAGWVKYHLDIAEEERAALQVLSDAGCSVETVTAYDRADFDGRYRNRFWCEPPFLERVREVKISGDAPAAALVRVASLPGVAVFEQDDFTWPDRARPAAEVLGQSVPKLPPIQLAESAFPSATSGESPLVGEEFDVVLEAVRESWNRPRSAPRRVLLHAYETTHSASAGRKYDDSVRALIAQDDEKTLVQELSTSLVHLWDSKSGAALGADAEGEWYVQRRRPGDSSYARRIEVFYRMKGLPVPELRPNLLDGRSAFPSSDATSRIEGPKLSRLEDALYRIDVAEIHRWDNEHMATIQRTDWTFVVSEASEWLPTFQRRTWKSEGGYVHDGTSWSDAYRYDSTEGQILLAEHLSISSSTESQYQGRSHYRYAWDLDPDFDETTFDPRRLVGPDLALPDAYPFRWYWIPLVAGFGCQTFTTLHRMFERFGRRRTGLLSSSSSGPRPA